MNLMMLLEMACSGTPERVAVQNGGESLRFDALYTAAARAAALLRESGAERLALLDVTSLALPVALFGSAWAGLPFAPLNYRLTERELADRVAALAPVLIVTQEERLAALSGLPGATLMSREAFLARCLGAGPTAEPAGWSMEGDDIAVLLFTSGTTGPPKAALLRQRHLVSYILGAVEFGAAQQEHAALVSVPPYHVAGIAAALSSVYAGRRVVQLPAFDPERWLALVESERISHAFVVPTMLARIVETLAPRGPGKWPWLESLSYGGGRMPQTVIEQAMRLFPDAGFTNAYGLTETSSTLSILTPEDHRAALASDDPATRRRLTSAGRPLPALEVEIRGTDGRALAHDEPGEIFVRGEQVSGEYLGRDSSLAGDGWLATRDGGWLDREGYLFVEGRIDDIIVRGGENLSPGEIEEVLRDHPAVADAAVVGLPDEEWGEAVAAMVVLRAGAQTGGQIGSEIGSGMGGRIGAEDLRAFVRERLRSSRAPERIAFRDALPYSETGKLLRRVVRAELLDDA